MTSVERWWVRRGGDPKGPFPTAVLENNIRLGRVRADDLLSSDGETWSPGHEISRFSELWGTVPDPPVVGVDERIGERRAATDEGSDRLGDDRRIPEDPELVARRERANRVWSGLRRQQTHPSWRAFLVLGVLVTGIFLLSTQGTRLGADDARCTVAPAPDLNWEFCNLVGRDLRGQDLSRTNLRNAKLTGVDLTAARLEGADLAYADLSGAILSKADFSRARLAGANLTAATLKNSDFTGADLSYADFSRAHSNDSKYGEAKFADTLLPSAQPCSDEGGNTACARLMEPRAP